MKILPVPGFSHYSASDDGRIWSDRREIFLRPCHNSWYGGVTVKLRVRKKYRTVGIHTLVLLAFVGPAPTGMKPAWKNGNRADNRLSNLEYRVPRAGTRKFTEDDIRAMRAEYAAGMSQRAIAKMHSTTVAHVNRIVRRIAWPDV